MSKGKIALRLVIIFAAVLYVAIMTGMLSRLFAQATNPGYNSSGTNFGGNDIQASASPLAPGQFMANVAGKLGGVPAPTMVVNPCPLGQVVTGVVNNVTQCANNGVLTPITYAGLVALGQFSVPTEYFCIDCLQSTFQCLPAGVGTPGGALAIPVATTTIATTATATSTLTSTATGATSTATTTATATATTAAAAGGIIYSCPNFAATAIASPSATPTSALSIALLVTSGAGPAPLAVTFNAQPSGGASPITYAWTWGDGSPTATNFATPSRTYPTPGLYPVSVTATDNNGKSVTQVKNILATGTSFYVTKKGLDTNPGTSVSPFLTLTKCQTAMRGSGTKVCTIADSGTYILGANFALNFNDNGEQWVAGFGSSPIIDGAKLYQLTAVGVTTLAFEGFRFQNMNIAATNSNAALSFGYDGSVFNIVSGLTFRWNTVDLASNTTGTVQGITAPGLASGLIDSNNFLNQISPVSAQNTGGGAMLIWNTPTSNTISHNFCNNLWGYCVNLQAGTNNSNGSNNTVTLNIAKNVGIQSFDMGAFYYCDSCSPPNLNGSSTGNVISYNQVFGNLTSNNNALVSGPTSAYYLDARTNNVVLKGNVCNQCGNFALHVNGFRNTTITQNIFDTSADQQYIGGGVTAGILSEGIDATGSSFDHNIIYNDSVAWPVCGIQSWWFLLNGLGTPLPPATDTTNLYFSTSGNFSNPNGILSGCAAANVTDANPFNANPLFVSPSTNNYTLSPSSPAYPNLGWTNLPTTQGPINSPFVATGSVF